MPGPRRQGWTVCVSSWVICDVKESKIESELKAGAKRKIELTALAVEFVALYRNSVVQTERGAGHHQAQPESEIVVVSPWIEVKCGAVDEADVVENGRPDGVDDLHRVLGGEHAVGLASDRLGEDVAGAHLLVLESAQGLGTAEVEGVVVGQGLEAAVVLDDAAVGHEFQDLLLGLEDLEVLRPVEFELVEVVGAAKGSAGQGGREVDAVARGRADDLVAG